jgi:hypothetical protein
MEVQTEIEPVLAIEMTKRQRSKMKPADRWQQEETRWQ